MLNTKDTKDLRLAVLIDADNVPKDSIKAIMAEIAVYGTPTIKRIYGDWTSPNIGGWKSLLLEHAITPIQQYSYTVGKNSTDSAMIIDAMDILYSGQTDGFCIVSSDSDFTRLAIRLREAGMKVIGIGEKKTPSPFIVACDKFIYIEVIRSAAREKAAVKSASKNDKTGPSYPSKSSHKKPASKKSHDTAHTESGATAHNDSPPSNGTCRVPDSIVELIADSVADIADEDGYAFMGELGNLLLKKQPDFDPRNFGFSKLTPMIRSLNRFEVDVRQTADVNIKHIYLRDKEA
ncbi:MAG: NYN domain-containing protein [Clostridiales bacterium]|jgi:uncharacterized LabA/DUF88 family protein/Fe-S-cluster formation regulator IscX/YfhJ|nr:NYN domain-containing protein [Clostridiales bacterium]